MKIKYIALCLLLALVGCQRDEEMEIGQVSVSNERLEASYSSVEISCTFQTNVTIKNVKAYVSTAQDFSSATSYLLTEKAKNTFGANIEELKDASTYYVRYEISNRWSSKVVDYVSEFKTLPYQAPIVVITKTKDISHNSAVIEGEVVTNGSIVLTECGVVYSTVQKPTIKDSKIIVGNEKGSFTCYLTDLQDATTYYARAYATNAKGTVYGAEVSFTTLKIGMGIENGHIYVDLGLSVKWATCNVGASKAEDYGSYFAWGETTTKYNYNWTTYKWCEGADTTLTKYVTISTYGVVDYKTTLELSDDAVRANMGGNWRIPTKAEMTELRNNCTWTWTTQTGVNGYKVTSQINGNSIFLPAAGDHRGSSSKYGCYWSSLLDTKSPDYAWVLSFNSSHVGCATSFRYMGHSVRPVLGEYMIENTLPFIATSVVTQITETTAMAGGDVLNDGNASVTERGVVYSTSQKPTTNNHKVTSGSGIGAFTCNLTDLNPGTTYYVRAYAINSEGTAYGEAVSFTTEDISVSEPTGIENGYGYVDLGLSIKWATMNVGADSSEDYGDYFAWGETTTKSSYDWSNYKYCNGSYDSLTKYNTNSSYGTVDNKTQLDLTDDAAYMNWGGTWRMPTDAELTELQEQCTWTWITLNDVGGYKVVSNSNGNSIFLPAAGQHDFGVGSTGYYWSSSRSTQFERYDAWSMCFSLSDVRWYVTERYEGHSVRPVCP